MKQKDSIRLSTIRLVRASIKNKEIEIGKEIDDDGVIGIISTAIKQRKDSQEQYIKAGRDDLAEKEDEESKILLSYMPEQAAEVDIRNRVREVITESDATSMKDMGKVMKVIMTEFRGKAEGSLINKIVKESLGAA